MIYYYCFLQNRFVFQERPRPAPAQAQSVDPLEKLHQQAESLKKLQQEIEKSAEKALKNDPESYLSNHFVLTNQKEDPYFYVTNHPDAVSSVLISQRLILKQTSDKQTREKITALIVRLELFNEFRVKLDTVFNMLAVAESVLNYFDDHPTEQMVKEDGGSLAARAVDLINGMIRNRDKYMPITTYTDILHPDAVEYVRDFFVKETLLDKAQAILESYRSRKQGE